MNKIAAIDIGNFFLGAGAGGSKGSASFFESLSSIGGLVNLFLDIAFVLSGLILLFYFILGGVGMIAGAGESDPQKAEAAKKTLTGSLIGFVVVFSSYWIVKLLGELLNIPIL